jgi:2-hydroxy-4-carboxymuconate semialdehyde hemiacetal dehydrogenase
MPPVDPKTGTPMDVYYAVETIRDQSLVFVGSYYGKEQMYEVMTITDRDSYNMDMYRNMLVTGAGTQTIDNEKLCNARVVWDFLAAVREGRDPRVAGPSVLPAMRILQEIQDQWDRIHGAQSILGRPLPK